MICPLRFKFLIGTFWFCSTVWGQYTDGLPANNQILSFWSIYACNRYTMLNCSGGIEESPATRLLGLGGGFGTTMGLYLDKHQRIVLNADLNTTFSNTLPVVIYNDAINSPYDFKEKNTLNIEIASLRTGLRIGYELTPCNKLTITPILGVDCSVHYWGRGIVKTTSPNWNYTQEIDIFRTSPWYIPSARFYNVGLDNGVIATYKSMFFTLIYNIGVLSATPQKNYSTYTQDISFGIGYNI